jgi:hypothetical protein
VEFDGKLEGVAEGRGRVIVLEEFLEFVADFVQPLVAEFFALADVRLEECDRIAEAGIDGVGHDLGGRGVEQALELFDIADA